MKIQIFTWLILLAISLQVSSKMMILIGFTINQDFISAELCVNRDKPQKQCNGHCQLSKQLDKDQKNDQLPTQSGKEKFEITWFGDNSYFVNPIRADESILTFSSPLITLHHPFRSSIFHPPNS